LERNYGEPENLRKYGNITHARLTISGSTLNFQSRPNRQTIVYFVRLLESACHCSLEILICNEIHGLSTLLEDSRFEVMSRYFWNS
jgi:hypothetical protein